MKKLLLLLVILFLYLTLYALSANAQTMSNGSYIIQMGNFNMSSGRPTGSGYKLLNTVGQTGPGLYSGPNYKVRAGFEYILSRIPFRFTISNTFIDFGPLTPKNFSLRSNILTVSNGSAFGYQVTTSQNHNLRSNAYGVEIPATACDGPTCTTTTAAPWTSFLTAFGFGYNCTNLSGTDCASDFSNDPTYFRPFASSPSAVIVMRSPNVGRNKQATITYKVNIDLTQAAGLYTNIINYIATPTF